MPPSATRSLAAAAARSADSHAGRDRASGATDSRNVPLPLQETKFPSLAGTSFSPSRLSRAEALHLQAIYDVSDWAAREGFLVPVAVSRNLWNDLCNVPPESTQTPESRLADVLCVARWTARKEPLIQVREMTFTLALPVGIPDRKYESYGVLLVADAGDNGKPVVTLYRQGE